MHGDSNERRRSHSSNKRPGQGEVSVCGAQRGGEEARRREERNRASALQGREGDEENVAWKARTCALAEAEARQAPSGWLEGRASRLQALRRGPRERQHPKLRALSVGTTGCIPGARRRSGGQPAVSYRLLLSGNPARPLPLNAPREVAAS